MPRPRCTNCGIKLPRKDILINPAGMVNTQPRSLCPHCASEEGKTQGRASEGIPRPSSEANFSHQAGSYLGTWGARSRNQGGLGEPMRNQRSEVKQYKQHDKFRKVMGEFKAGTLKSSSGDSVTNKKQAKAIAVSEAKRAHQYDARGSHTQPPGQDRLPKYEGATMDRQGRPLPKKLARFPGSRQSGDSEDMNQKVREVQWAKQAGQRAKAQGGSIEDNPHGPDDETKHMWRAWRWGYQAGDKEQYKREKDSPCPNCGRKGFVDSGGGLKKCLNCGSSTRDKAYDEYMSDETVKQTAFAKKRYAERQYESGPSMKYSLQDDKPDLVGTDGKLRGLRSPWHKMDD